MWEENYVGPLLALECVSHKYGGEYDEKQQKYVNLGVLYYVVYKE
ncbi:MAG: Uma2 family endonuclease [Rhizonema sp. PD38]|nr:Uma2 family endonuclease [Rhizonema sp. PD38]